MMLDTPSILITDDDRAFRETLEAALRPRGFHTVLAANGREAVQIVQQQPVHLALLDMHMPLLTGLETIREVRRLRAALPCILISGALDEMILREAEAADVFSVLAKPVSVSDVHRAVGEALEVTYNWPGRR